MAEGRPMSSNKLNPTSSASGNTEDLLFEIGLEELPPKNLGGFANTFGQNLEKALNNANLAFSAVETFVAPRRLAGIIRNLQRTQPEQTVVKRGPSKEAAFDKEGKPTQAALGFAKSCQTSIENMRFQETDKGSFLIFEQKIPGQDTPGLIPNLIQEVLQNLPLPKRMRWGDSSDVFVRPVHWLVLLFGNQVIPAKYFGIETSNASRGHRFHHPKDIVLSTANDYESLLQSKGKVIAHPEKRKQLIQEKLIETAGQLGAGAHAIIDPELLDQVGGLVEWPVVLLGKFEDSFLSLPKEVLISAMQVHQKCFPIVDDKNALLSHFLIVSNIESSNPKTVIEGNERVMQARLHDAAFYYKEDQKISLEERQVGLKQVVFQQGLGTLWDKAQRISSLAGEIAKQTGMSESMVKDCKQVSGLCKTDLLTQMVSEFPELQGVMGKHYYLNPQKNTLSTNSEQYQNLKQIAEAIEEHYHPRFAEDSLPNSLVGAVIAIADRIDSLVGLFGLGKIPTGDKDPYAQRRQALAVLRILIEEERWTALQSLDLERLFEKAHENYRETESYKKFPPVSQLSETLMDFFYERLRAWYHEKGIPARSFDAVLAKRPNKPHDFNQRLLAVTAFQTLPEAESLSAANKRVRNILEKNSTALSEKALRMDPALLKEEAEKKLAHILQEKEAEIKPLIQAGSYTEALKILASLKEPIDGFFDHVMVMVEDVPLRNNRIALLERLRALFLEIADISVL